MNLEPHTVEGLLRRARDVVPSLMREKVIEFEKLAKKVPQVRLKVEHCFWPGYYMRVLYIPAGIITPGKIHKRDLETDTPYNTYLHKGLPPTPIAMPSLNAIKAVTHPDHNDYLYFVQDHLKFLV